MRALQQRLENTVAIDFRRLETTRRYEGGDVPRKRGEQFGTAVSGKTR